MKINERIGKLLQELNRGIYEKETEMIVIISRIGGRKRIAFRTSRSG